VHLLVAGAFETISLTQASQTR